MGVATAVPGARRKAMEGKKDMADDSADIGPGEDGEPSAAEAAASGLEQQPGTPAAGPDPWAVPDRPAPLAGGPQLPEPALVGAPLPPPAPSHPREDL